MVPETAVLPTTQSETQEIASEPQANVEDSPATIEVGLAVNITEGTLLDTGKT